MSQAPEQLALGVALDDQARFGNFFCADNGLLLSLLGDAAQGRAEPLYLWGKPGTGRSHLLQAACHHAGELGRSAIYLPLSELTELAPAVFDGMEAIQLVCLDDIDQIAGLPGWEEALFHLYNRIHAASDCQLVVAASQPPRQLPIKLDDLRSRLGWGVVQQLANLTDEQKVKALQLRSSERGFELSDEVVNYLIHHASRSMNDLFALLDQLDAASLSAQRKITVPFVKQTLGW